MTHQTVTSCCDAAASIDAADSLRPGKPNLPLRDGNKEPLDVLQREAQELELSCRRFLRAHECINVCVQATCRGLSPSGVASASCSQRVRTVVSWPLPHGPAQDCSLRACACMAWMRLQASVHECTCMCECMFLCACTGQCERAARSS